MKLKKNVSLVDFINTVKKCRNDVFFETDEGDHLNLKSTLSQFMFAASDGNRGYLENGSVICDNNSDYKILADYLEER